MTEITLPLAQARRLALRGHGLNDGWALSDGRSGAAKVVERLGYVQIDTIAVVERAHHHVIWSRYGAYEPQMLNDLLAHDRLVFEYWLHAACYLSMRDYRYFLPQMRAHRRSKRSREWLSNNKELVDQVLARIHEQGGLRAADFEAPEDFVRGAWWSRKPQKVALELLFERGDLMISAREGFQRRYDLRERVLPSWVDLTEPTPEETGRHLALQNLCRMGLVQERDMTLPRLHRKAVSLALADMLSSGEVMQVQIQGLDGEPYLCLADALSGADEPDDKAHILSPFDPLTIQRRWLRALFDLDYALECYLPAAKRVHGYFSLPVLWRDRFVGRIDAKADRQPGKLLLKHLELEEPHELSDAFLRALSAACWRFAAFNGCGEICVQRGTPVEAADALQKALGAHGQA